jgi:NAD(P)-dependent dehydrogenase (short-subunit alcohol dehydrogenase family)
MKLFDLNGKVALVTGALGLIGKEHCRALYEAGAHVIVADLNFTNCQLFCRVLGPNSFPLEVDISNRKSIHNALSQLLLHYSNIDILVNNAAINDHFNTDGNVLEQSSFENYPEDLLEKSWSVNVKGMVLFTQALSELLKKSSSASVINIASTYGLVGPDQNLYKDENGIQLFFKTPAYPITKGAVINFTRYLAAYWGDLNIRVNTLSPGGVENGQNEIFINKYANKTPLKRMAKISDYRGALVFLASDASAYMTGANLVVDGGFTSI